MNKVKGCLTSIMIFLIVIIAVGLIGSSCGLGKSEEEKVLDEYGVSSCSDVRNDTTSRWKLATYADSAPVDEFVVEYYKARFESDDEIHVLINYQNKTTNFVTKTPNILVVRTNEHVDGEEHDVRTLGSGMFYLTRYVDIETGEIVNELH